MKLHLFNPDADLGLAHPRPNYIAPAHVRQMAADLALLPVWYAEPQSLVLAPSAYHTDFLNAMRRQFALSAGILTEPELCELPAGTRIMPWGWTPALRDSLTQKGVPGHLLPTREALQTLRARASRRWVSLWLKELTKDNACCGHSANLTTMEQCRAFAEAETETGCVLKAPWSGSGKGLRWCKDGFNEATANWCNRILREQGMVAASPIYNKVEDLAMEFLSDGQGGVTFAGYSLFATNAGGAYQGNLLLPEGEAEAHLSSLVGPDTLTRTRIRLQHLLTFYARSHTGYIGVDMMICRDRHSDRLLLHPCVEVNMRMTMGMAALLFRRQYLSPEAHARFRIEYHPTPSVLKAACQERLNSHPPVIKEGRLVSGYLPLVPLKPDSHYMAYVETCL